MEKLKVAADWYAPLQRNHAEYEWLKVAADINPNTAIRLFGHSEKHHGFVMEFLEGEGIYLWKDALLAEQPTRNEAAAVGNLLGGIHARSSRPDFDRSAFHNRDNFHALRIEPYLLFTAQQCPSVKPALHELGHMLYESSQVLVHGDVSPKNILFREDDPILLDAECATMGDSSFDVAFCLNHLVLKAVHLAGTRQTLLNAVEEFWDAYQTHIVWEAPDALDARVCRLLPALMLARVDGKSPVEYLNEQERTQVRDLAFSLIGKPKPSLSKFIQHLAAEILS